MSWYVWAIAILLALLAAWLVHHFTKPRCEDCDRRISHGCTICWVCSAERRAKLEPVRRCPADGNVMAKRVRADWGVIVDVCPAGCAFFEGNELQSAVDSERASSQSTGMLYGLAIGQAID